MEYKEINESWENFKSSIQSSNYMQRLSLKRDEELFREGYMRGYEVAVKNLKTEVNEN